MRRPTLWAMALALLIALGLQSPADGAAHEDGGLARETEPWGPESARYAATYGADCPAGDVRSDSRCVPLAAWLAGRGFAKVCVVDARGGGDATTIAGCGFASGQATVVRAGTYREDVRPTASGFALVAYPGEHPVVSGADMVAPGGWVAVGGGVWRHPWVWQALDNGNGRTSTGRRREVLVVDGSIVRGVGGDARPELADGRFWVEGPPSAPTAIYFDPPGDLDPNATTVEIGQRSTLFWPADAPGGRCRGSRLSGLLVAGMTFRHGTANRQRFAVCLGDADGTVLDADIGWQNGGGLDLAGSRHRATGNRIHDNGIEGVGGTGSVDVVLAFNEVRGNGWDDPAGSGHGGGGKFTRSRGLVVEGNVYADNAINGLWLDIDNRNAIVAGNLLVDNDNAGLFLELFSDSTVVVNNVCASNRLRPRDGPGAARLAGCLRLTDASATVVAFNTVVQAANAALIVFADDRSLWPCDRDGVPACGTNEARAGQNPFPPRPDGQPRRADGTVVLNNVFLSRAVAPYTNTRGQRVTPRASAIRVAVPGAVGSVWGGNWVWAPGGGVYSQASGEMRDHAAWAGVVGSLGGGVLPGPLAAVADTTSVGGMSRLAAGSPARGGAVPVPPAVLAAVGPQAAHHLIHDVWGHPRRVPADAGAGWD